MQHKMNTNPLNVISERLDINNALAQKFYDNKEFEKAANYYKEILKEYIGITKMESKIKDNFTGLAEIIDCLKIRISECYTNLGKTYADNNEFENAINSYKIALLYNSNDYKISYYIGLSFRGLKRFDIAITFLKKAIKLNPSFADIYKVIGDIFVIDKKIKEEEFKAYKYYAKFITMNKSDGYVYNNLAYLLMENPNIKYKTRDKQIQYLNKAAELLPNIELAFYNLGMIYNEKKEYDSAIEAYQKLIKINPNNINTVNSLGAIYESLNKTDLALECYKKAHLLNPEDSGLLLKLGLIYKNKNMIKESIQYYKKLSNLKLDNQNPLNIENSIDENIKYLLLKDRKLNKVSKTNKHTNIKTAIIYFYEDKFDQKAYDLFISSLNNQTFKNYTVFTVNNNFSEILQKIETLQFNLLCFVAQNDLFDDNALNLIVETVSINKNIDLVYTDEDLMTEDGSFQKPYFKTEYAEFILLSHNYMNALLCLKLNPKIFEELNTYERVDQAFLYKLVLKLMHQNIKTYRIPEVLYHRHWKNFEKLEQTSTKDIIEEELKARNYNAKIIEDKNKYYNLVKFYPDENPKVSIIIPFKDKIYLLKNCIESIEKKSTYKNYEIILVNNQSTEAESLEYFNNSKHKKLNADFMFNFARINNIAAQQAKGKYLLFLNNDIEIITPDWIENLLGLAQLKHVGSVGAKLLYSNNTIQHAGSIKNGRNQLMHANKHLPSDFCGYKNYNFLIREYLTLIGACIMVSKEKFDKVGEFDEDFVIECSDTDLDFKLIEAGYINLNNPNCVLYHHESISRKGLFYGDIGNDINSFYKKWNDLLYKPDPYYNPNLSDYKTDFSIKVFK